MSKKNIQEAQELTKHLEEFIYEEIAGNKDPDLIRGDSFLLAELAVVTFSHCGLEMLATRNKFLKKIFKKHIKPLSSLQRDLCRFVTQMKMKS